MPKGCVIDSGFSVGYFKINRGIRLGDLLSLYPFVLALETIEVRPDKNIRGFNMKNIMLKLTAYADDTIFFVKDGQSHKSMSKAMKKFQEFSSLKANIEKCEACLIGRAKYEKINQ